jgi:hypothetical protein
MSAAALERHSDLSSYKILKGQFTQRISPAVVDQHTYYVETNHALKIFSFEDIPYKMKCSKTKAHRDLGSSQWMSM